MTHSFNNIPKSGYNSLQPEFKTGMLMVSRRMTDIITLSIFSIVQLLAGLKELEKETLAKVNNPLLLADPFVLLRLAGKLYEAAIAPTRADETDIRQLEVTRDEVKMMIELLNARMLHCEIQRDNEDPRFNPDTYIGQKLLLIDLREWLMIEQVMDVTEMAEAASHGR